MTVPQLQDTLQSVDAEKAVLGSIFINPACFIEVASILKSSDDFFLTRHKIIFQAIDRVRTRKDEIDLITVADDLENTGDLANVGGRAYLTDLMNGMGTSMHAPVYAKLVQRTAIRRRMLKPLDEMRGVIADEALNIEDVKAQTDSTWLNATSDTIEQRGEWFGDVLSRVYDDIERAMARKDSLIGISTGLRDVDNLTYGFEPEQLIILAGRPGMGKSAAMDNMALSIAKNGHPVFYATSERSAEMVVRRMAAIHMQINTCKLRDGNLSPGEMARLTRGIDEIYQLPIFIEDTPMPRPRDIYAQADWMVKRHKCKVVLFDGMYRSKTGVADLDKDDRKKYGTIALELKTMARALRVPVVTTHQLNRNVEQRQDKRPVMSDLRESGRIEEEADKIIFLYRDEVYNDMTEFPNQCDWILAKHRDGGTGVASTYFEKTFTKFMDASVHRVDLSDLE